ncbi:Hemin-binding periplasmic protein HmuT [Tepidimonas alkaliphilus]|uniref:Hemin-binding periplasmic protein HmuT n=1 Tax=Tepidimonas alkaliphilus TaxID=2588942 RepID=A0A554W9Z3_9BURK|nr:ABC transporter substrate-binding protein [Tepidimonas alkaliphilus]TSE20398.1 Hemin-binding periplasmic protein HmuT [Tepidimonas alkaliphilus]
MSRAGVCRAPSIWRRRDALAILMAAPAAAWSPVSAQRSPRLVTVGGALTEIAFALGAQGQLVGVDSTSDYPEAAQRLPRVGYMRQLSAEGVLALRPDALVATSEAGPAAVLRQLREAGLTLRLIPVTHDWDDLQRKIEVMAEVTQRLREGQALLERLRAQRQRLQAHVSPSTRGPRALFVLAHGGSPMVAGRQTAADAVLQLMGARNAVSGYAGYRPLSAEAVLTLQPDLIVTTTQSLRAVGGEAAFWARPEWALWPMERRRLWHDDALALLGFGPRLPEVIERAAQAIGTWRPA